MSDIRFPRDFLWGAATASYQIEGAVHEDGRGETIWDRFSHTPGKTFQGQNGDVSCDHYHRYREDVGIMKDLGLRSYRFSICWSRIFPSGWGRINRPGLDFYQRLADELMGAGIIPMVTLYHWDLPLALQDKGGWQERDTIYRFGDYATAMYEQLGDRVKQWITLNEPWVISHIGHRTGEHAPGIRDEGAAIQVAHHLLLAHSLAARIYREYSGNDGRIGIALDLHPIYPESEASEDREAVILADGSQNRWFLDPVFTGEYPRDMLEIFSRRHGRPQVRAGDMEELRASRIDFLGVNYYFRQVARKPDDAKELFSFSKPRYEGVRFTDMGWEIYPEGLYRLLKRLDRSYGHPELFITENGAAFPEGLNDEDRIDYLREHVAAAHRALEEGVKLRGYYIWSLLDNFEWAHGFSKRFGLVHVDYETLVRTPKKSASWYREVIRNNGF